MPRSDFRIIPFRNPSGVTVWRVTGTLDGKQVRVNRRTEIEAVTVKQNFERKALNLTPLPAITTRLTADQAAEAEAVFRGLNGFALTLTEAVDFARANYVPAEKNATIEQAFDLFIAAKRKANKRPHTIRSLEQRVGHMVRALAGRNVNQVTAGVVKPFIFREGSGMTNQHNYYRAISGFFNWCVGQKFSKTSPLETVEGIECDAGDPVAFSLEEAQALVNAAHILKNGALLPFVVLGLFCGIRPNGELSRLKWSNIDLKKRLVKIGADVGKTRGRSRRLVEISENAVSMLAPHALKQTPIVGKNWRRDFDAVKTLAGWGTITEEHPHLKMWVKDIMRHTAITFHLALHENEGKTAAWAGNSPDIIHNSYKALVPEKSDVAKFWQLQPENTEPAHVPNFTDGQKHNEAKKRAAA